MFDQQLTEVQSVLLNAAQEVRKGWCQYTLEQGGSVCALGALGRVACGSATSISQSPTFFAAWGKLTDRVGLVTEWNNADGRTAEQVAEEMEAAAFD